MDDFLKKVERLSELAARRADPRPLDTAGLMAGIRGLEIEDETLAIPFGFLTGGAAAAAAAAAVSGIFAMAAWTELSNPIPEVLTLLDVMDAVL